MSVTPLVYTTFFIGLECGNLAPLTSVISATAPSLSFTYKPSFDNQGTRKPHYHILFSTSYGLDRNQLEQLNHRIRTDYLEPFNPEVRGGKFSGCPTREGQDINVYTSDVSPTLMTWMCFADIPRYRTPLSLFPWLNMWQARDQALFSEKLEYSS